MFELPGFVVSAKDWARFEREPKLKFPSLLHRNAMEYAQYALNRSGPILSPRPPWPMQSSELRPPPPPHPTISSPEALLAKCLLSAPIWSSNAPRSSPTRLPNSRLESEESIEKVEREKFRVQTLNALPPSECNPCCSLRSRGCFHATFEIYPAISS